MSKMNTRRPSPPPIFTANGARATNIPPLAQLRRTVSTCLLWENDAFEDGESIAVRIASLVRVCSPPDIAALALEVRSQLNLRHVPLLLLRELACHPDRARFPQVVSQALAATIQRPDEIPEFLRIYWKDGRRPISKQVKRGLAWALKKFNEYSISKYKAEGTELSIRDVMFLVHAKPKDSYERHVKADRKREKTYGPAVGGVHDLRPHEALYNRIAEKKLVTPDTWETQLSAGADKRATFTRLILQDKLGYMALLRNLRNMNDAGVDHSLINAAIRARQGGADKVLPFRFIMAARSAMPFFSALDDAMQANMAEMPRLPGRTLVLVDNSGSMYQAKVSAKSDMDRADAAQGVAVIARGICEHARVFSFSTGRPVEIPAYKGLALPEAINRATMHGGTELGAAVMYLNSLPHDRIIVISDEQTSDPVPAPAGLGYMINVASAKNGVGYGPWVHIDGWSDAVIRFIADSEKFQRSQEVSEVA